MRKDDGKEIPTAKRAKSAQLYSSGRLIFISPVTYDSLMTFRGNSHTCSKQFSFLKETAQEALITGYVI